MCVALVLMIHFLVAEMDLELDSKRELGFAETNNRPVNAAGEPDGCVYKCNDISFDFYSCNGVLKVTPTSSPILKMSLFVQIHCSRTYSLPGGWQLKAKIENECTGLYTNSTGTSTEKDDIQIRVLCDGTFRTRFNVSSSLSNGFGSKLSVDYECGDAFSSVTNKDLGRHGELGLNFYQNTFCNGTETSKIILTAPGDDSIFSEVDRLGGGVLKTYVGSCETAARVLSTIDIFGVLYCYMIVPDCDPNAGIVRGFSQVIQPATILCDGAVQKATDSCSGFLLTIAKLNHGTATFKCRGDYVVKNNTEFSCIGETHGEQMRRGRKMTFVRSNVCVGTSWVNPVHGMQTESEFFEGSTSICYGATVKSTIIGPPPFVSKHTLSKRHGDEGSG